MSVITVSRRTPALSTAPAIESVSEAAQSSPIDSASDARDQFRVELPVKISQIGFLLLAVWYASSDILSLCKVSGNSRAPLPAQETLTYRKSGSAKEWRCHCSSAIG